MTMNTHRWGPEGAPRILALHAAGTDGRTWRGLARRLKQSRILAPDLLGHGKSEGGSHGGYPEALRALEDAFFRDSDGPLKIVGHSFGGMLALHLAARHPSRVHRVVVYEPVAFAALAPECPEAAAPKAFFAAWDPAAPEAWLEGFFDYWSGPGTWERFPRIAKRRFAAGAARFHAEAHSVTFASENVYGAVSQEVHLLQGSESPPVVGAIVDALRAQIPKSRTTTLPNVAHMAPLEAPDVVFGAMEAALSGFRG